MSKNKKPKNDTTSVLDEKAVMIRLRTKLWSGIKSSKKAREALAEKSDGGSEGAFNGQLNLTGDKSRGNNPNTYFRGILTKFKNESFHPLTHAWEDGKDGWRLCSVHKQYQVLDAFNKAKIEWEKEVDGFVKDLPKIKAMFAKSDLGIFYDESFYPQGYSYYDENEKLVKVTADEVLRSKFKFDLDTRQVERVVNVKDIRLEVSEEMKTRLVNDTKDRLTRNLIAVGKNAVDEVVDNIENLTTRMREYNSVKGKKRSGTFHKTNVPKIEKSLSVLADLNAEILGNDPTISKVHKSLTSKVNKLKDEKYFSALRDDTFEAQEERDQVSDSLDDSIADLKGDFLNKAFGRSDNND